MSKKRDIPPVHGPIITGINLVDCLTRHDRSTYRAVSLPGHLIHLVTEGRVEQRTEGMRQEISPGSAVWYHENQPVSGRILETPWTFYTVNFSATIFPPPYDRRVTRYEPETLEKMKELHAVWLDDTIPPTTRQLRLHALLLKIILDILPEESHDYRVDDLTSVWWAIEAQLRRDLSIPISLESIQKLGHCSLRKINQACNLSVGKSPMKRVKELRLSYARGLVQFSDLSMTEIAFSVGYSRVQELSRDYRSAYGATPTQDRKKGPDYRDHQKP